MHHLVHHDKVMKQLATKHHKKVRHASKDTLQAIGKIARFEQMKEKSAVPNILDDILINNKFKQITSSTTISNSRTTKTVDNKGINRSFC